MQTMSLFFDQSNHILIRMNDAKCFRKLHFNVEAFNIEADGETKYNLGVAYYNGKSVPQNFKTWIQWVEKSADQGYINAQATLGFLYDKGNQDAGILQDYSAAMLWYRKAADQGHDIAQINLGTLYATGRGVQRNDALAKQWYQKAADQGNEIAKRNLDRFKQTSGTSSAILD